MKKGMQKGICTLAIGALLATGACKKKIETVYQYYTVPTAYNFENVDYAEATTRVNMWAAFNTYLGKSTSRQLSQDTANYLWNNTNTAFTTEMVSNNTNTTVVLPLTPTQLNNSSFNLAGKTTDAASFKAAIDTLVKHSQYYNLDVTSIPGITGKINDRLVSYKGLEYSQVVNKGLMGAFAMAQIIAHLDKVPSSDNNIVVTGKGTAMQHEWDMAFGYIGIPKNYDSSVAYSNTDVNRPLGIGGYFRERGRFIGAGGTIFSAFLKGRAAIAAKDYAGRDAAIATIKEYLEKTFAAALWNYVVQPKTSTGSATLGGRLHQLSEGYGFMLALKYRAASSKLTASNYQKLADIMNSNFFDLLNEAPGFAKLTEAKEIIRAAYGKVYDSE